MAAKKKSTSDKTKRVAKKKTAKSKKAVSAKSRPAARVSATTKKKNKKKNKKTSNSKKRRAAPKTKAKTKAQTKIKKRTVKTTTAKNKKVTARKANAGKTNEKAGAKSTHNPGPTKPEPRRKNPPSRPKKTWLSKEDLVYFEKLLLEKRAELVGNVQGLSNEALRKNRSESSGDVSSMPTHMADLGSDNWEQEFTLGLIEKERTLLHEIDAALDRIKNRTYGICLASNKRILKNRLKAKPWAKYCIDYAKKKELGLVR